MRSEKLVDGVKDVPRFLRAAVFYGNRYVCPICGWHLRTFSDRRNRGGLFARTHNGYCPRCGAKARHRRMWLYLKENTELFVKQHRFLHVAPRPALGKRLMQLETVDYCGVGLKPGPTITTVADVTSLPMEDNTFDALICVHVLEHVKDDRRAMAEMFRVLKPGGWALISFPLRFDQPTREDITIRDPAERKRLFGERGHFRWYGTDAIDRLREVGFEVTLDRGSEIPADVLERHGLRDDENIFRCIKPAR